MKNKIATFLFDVSVLYGCFITAGFLHERLFSQNFGTATRSFHFEFPVILIALTNLFQVLIVQLRKRKTKPIERLSLATQTKCIFVPSLFQAAAAWFTNKALLLVSFPTAVVFKSVKMLPVMAMGRLFLQKKYSRRKYLSALLIMSGLVAFTLLGPVSRSQKKTDRVGVLYLVLALFADGLIAFLQEKGLQKGNVSSEVYAQKGGMAVFCACLLIVLQERRFYFPVFKYAACTELALARETVETRNFFLLTKSLFINLAAFVVLQALGMVLISKLLFEYGTLAVATVTTLRKFLTVMLSVAVFGHGFTQKQKGAVVLVFAGIFFTLTERKLN